MTEAELHILQLQHVLTSRDRSVEAELDELGIPHVMAGFTEWFVPRLGASLGWDWYVPSAGEALALAPWEARSNVMLIGHHLQDLGWKLSDNQLKTWLNSFPWQRTIEDCICNEFTQLNDIVAICGAQKNMH